MRALMRERMLELGAIVNDAPMAAPPLRSPGVTAPIVGTIPTIAVPRKRRTFRRGTAKPIIGEDVKAFQRCLNRRFEAWGIAPQVRENGRYGDQTYQAARRALHALGLNVDDMAHGITPLLRDIVRDPKLRTDEQRHRAAGRREWLRRFKARHPLNTKSRPAKAGRPPAPRRTSHPRPPPGAASPPRFAVTAAATRTSSSAKHDAITCRSRWSAA